LFSVFDLSTRTGSHYVVFDDRYWLLDDWYQHDGLNLLQCDFGTGNSVSCCVV